MQTYATIKTLRQLGHDVTLINLVHPKSEFKNKYVDYRSLFSLVKIFQFYLFRKRFFGKSTKKMHEFTGALPKADYTIVGSDQVWNGQITTQLRSHYFLDFVTEGKKIAYASSFGRSIWIEDQNYTDHVKSWLSDFEAISVREETGVEICSKVFGVNAERVIDPTLMHTSYKELIKSEKPIHRVYRFLFINNDTTNSICGYVSNRLGIPLYSSSLYEDVFKCSPIDWLNRIKNSDFIITDSFHGLAFSIIFHKRFIVLCADKSKFTRLQTLLCLLGLEDRYVKDLNDILIRNHIIDSSIDYTKVDNILDNERNRSLLFLKQNIR